MRLFILALLLGLMQPQANATDDRVDALLRALLPLESLQGNFRQVQYGQDDRVLAKSSGQFRLLRPGYLSWEIDHPDSQLVVADPRFVWHHDRDLETVTRRPLSLQKEGAPL